VKREDGGSIRCRKTKTAVVLVLGRSSRVLSCVVRSLIGRGRRRDLVGVNELAIVGARHVLNEEQVRDTHDVR
jgi:hypothetical protein